MLFIAYAPELQAFTPSKGPFFQVLIPTQPKPSPFVPSVNPSFPPSFYSAPSPPIPFHNRVPHFSSPSKSKFPLARLAIFFSLNPLFADNIISLTDSPCLSPPSTMATTSTYYDFLDTHQRTNKVSLCKSLHSQYEGFCFYRSHLPPLPPSCPHCIQAFPSMPAFCFTCNLKWS